MPESRSQPAAGAAVGVAETHIGIVFLVGDRAYKLKKPVDLGFLDFTTREARHAACTREVELNRRLAPDVYLGVADVTDVDGEVCDHLVVMRRMPADRRLSALVAAGNDVEDGVRAVARLVARFHSQAARDRTVSEAATAAAVQRNWADNVSQVAPFVGPILDGDVAARTAELARRYIAGRVPLFARRIVDGRIVDGHGDLLADDIFLLDDGPRVLDCIEFDDRLRHGDVLADVAFLAMDLERLGSPELATRLLGWYREFSGETWPDSLAHHYIAYRAHVRAKVACLRADQGDAEAGEHARTLLGIAHDHLELGRVRVVLVGGLPGTGKSTLAAGIGRARGWTVLRSDAIRKELGGGRGVYTDHVTAATYDELSGRAARALGMGESVILDASWTSAARRDAARRLSVDVVADLVELRCDVDSTVASGRLVERARAGDDPSDATPDVAARMAVIADPWPEATVVSTSGPPEASLSIALART